MRRKEKQDKDKENLEHDIAQDNPTNPPSPSGDTIIGGHIPLAELGLVPFIPSKKHTVANLNTILFDKNKKTIVIR